MPPVLAFGSWRSSGGHGAQALSETQKDVQGPEKFSSKYTHLLAKAL
jgi:hypothetical protein